MLNNLNDNLTPQNCGNQQSYGMLTKRIKALEDTVSGYSELVSSQKGQFDDLEAQNGKISTLKTISTETDILNADSVRTGILQSGTTSLGDTTVKSLKISGPEGIVTDIDHADIKTADIGDLHVSGEITLDQPTLDRLELREDLKAKEVNTETVKIKNKKALETLIQELSIGTDFKNINFKSDMIPTWNNLELATKSDVSGLNFKSVVEAAENLPEVAAPGDLYWISSTAEVAVYSDGGFTLTPMPALAAYRTAAEEDKINVEIQANIDKANTDTNARVDETNKNVSTLDTRLTNAQIENDKTHEALTAAIDANKATITTAEGRLKVIEDDYVKNAPSDGNMYGMKDGSWQDLAKDSNFVPKEYKDETTDSHIFNDANGIDISSNKSVTVSTPEEKLETSKEIVNVDYMRKNLSISKDAGASSERKIVFKWDDKAVIENAFEDGCLGGCSTYTDGWHAMTNGFFNSGCRTKNYLWTTWMSTIQSAGTGNTSSKISILDKQGNSYMIPSKTFAGPAVYRADDDIAVRVYSFDPDSIKDRPELADYVYLVSAVTGTVEVWDGPRFVGNIEFPKGSDGEYLIKKDWTVFNAWGILCGVPLKGKPEILIYHSGSQFGYILGINEENEPDVMAMKRVNFPGFAGVHRIAGGKSYWWGLNNLDAARSSMMRIDWRGNTGSSPLQAEDGSGSCSSTNTYDNVFSFKTLKNGDVVFAINTKFAGSDAYTTGFAYCYENQGERLLPSYYIPTTLCWGNKDDLAVPASRYVPFIEAGNYVFFMPTVPGRIKQNGSTGSATESICGVDQAVLNQYCIINKTSHSITYATFPWALGADKTVPLNAPLKTKGGYYWCLPNYNVKDSKFLIVSPSGAQQTIDVGTGGNDCWMPMATFSGTYNSEWWYIQPAPNAAVNEDGIGCVATSDLSKILIFYGNGEYKLWDYGKPVGNTMMPQQKPLLRFNPGYELKPVAGSNRTRGCGMFAIGKTFIVPVSIDTDSNNVGLIYITPNKENPLLEPEIHEISISNNGSSTAEYGDWMYNADQIWRDYEERNKVLHNVEVSRGYGTYGHQTFDYIELPLKSADTIYLKDGEYVISDTSGTNYKKSIEETK